ncbi:MAG: class II aldolase/adducin family protein [Chloroflexota bacterium]
MILNSSSVGPLLKQMGEVGKRLSEIGATEGAAGNISICVRDTLEIREYFPQMQMVDLPLPAPYLAGATILATGSGRRLRDIADEPAANLAVIIIEDGGKTGRMFTSVDCPFTRVTSEFNSHLAVHHDQMRLRPIKSHAVIHAQPRHLTFLSHISKYQDERFFNSHLLRWQPETILNFPEGIGVLPFLLPGSTHLMLETMLCLRDHQLVIWSQHGVMSRADGSIFHALDLVEYLETAAHYEVLNLSTGEASAGISPENIRAVADSWNVKQKIY